MERGEGSHDKSDGVGPVPDRSLPYWDEGRRSEKKEKGSRDTNYTPPVIIVAAVAPAPAFITPAPPPPVQMAAPAANEALRGLPPPIFDGDRTQSVGFLLAFRLYKFTNRGHEAILNPATRTTTALSYIAGPLVEAWKEEQLTPLERNIAANVPEGDKAHWTTFQTNFTNTFTNTNKKNDTYRELQVLRHKDDLDTFIARFKQLVTAAELDIDSHGVIELLKQGLKQPLIQNVLTAPDYDPNATYTFADMEKRIRNSHLCWINSLAYRKTDQKQRLFTTFGVKPQGQPRNGRQLFKGGRRLTTSQGGNAMDVDTMEATNIDGIGFNQITKEEEAKLRAKNACFYCQKTGHRANDCYKKKRDRAQAGGSGRKQNDSKVKTADLIDFSTMTTDQRTYMDNKVIDYIQSETFMEKEDDEKLKFIEQIAPSGF